MNPTSVPRAHKAYVIWLGLIWAGFCVGVLAINILVDPLWHFHGNQLTEKNYAFNERQAKLNLLLSDPTKYDCLIFGSSRATLLPVDSLLPYRCFNLAFSGGQIEEFIAFANYLAHKRLRPSLVIVGVDGFNFLKSGRDPSNIPDYIVKGDDPPSFLKDYLSMGSLNMSWRTLIGDSPLPRYYDAQFAGQIQSDAPRFRPNKTIEGEGLRRADADNRSKLSYNSQNTALYKNLTQVFPAAQTIAYVPPISAWHVAQMEKNGVLSGYIEALFATAQHFPVFIDFALPSSVTWRTDNTYDGSHYQPGVNHSIAQQLLSIKPQTWGIAPKTISADVYHSRYREALEYFRLAAPQVAD